MAEHDQLNSGLDCKVEQFQSLSYPSHDEQPVFPMDYRQYRGLTNTNRFQGIIQRDNSVSVNTNCEYVQSCNDYSVPVSNYNLPQRPEIATTGRTNYDVEPHVYTDIDKTYIGMPNNNFHNNTTDASAMDAPKVEYKSEILIQEDTCNYDYLIKDDTDSLVNEPEEKGPNNYENEASNFEGDLDKSKVDSSDVRRDAEVGAVEKDTTGQTGPPDEVIQIKQEVIDDTSSYEVSSITSCLIVNPNVSGHDSDSTIVDESEKTKESEQSDDEPKGKKKRGRKRKNSKSQKKLDSVSPRKKANIKVAGSMFASTEKKDFKCDVCKKVVLSIRALEKHSNLHTGKYTCTECGKVCNSHTSLENHQKVHQGFIGSEVCKVCDKTFYDKSSLNKHTLSVHMGIKNFECEHCHLSFYAKKTYEEHVRVHTGERPFKCDICPKTYKRVADLNHHVRLHKGEISHTCEFCGEGYRRISELKRHMQKHSDTDTPIKPERQNVCEWCGIRFPTIKSLQNHTSKHIESLEVPTHRKEGNDTFFQEKNKMVEGIMLGLGNRDLGRDIASQSQVEGSLPIDVSAREFIAGNKNARYGYPYFRETDGNLRQNVSANQEQPKDTDTAGQVVDTEAENSINTISAKRAEKTSEQADTQRGYTKDVTSKENTNTTIASDRNNFEKDSGKVASDKNKYHYTVKTFVGTGDDSDSVKVKVEESDDDVDDAKIEYSKIMDDDDDDDDDDNDDYGSDTEIEDNSFIPKDEDIDDEDSDYTPTKSSAASQKKAAKGVPAGKPKKKVVRKGQKSLGSELENEGDIKIQNEDDRMEDKDDAQLEMGDKTDSKKRGPRKRKRAAKPVEPNSFICEECGKFFSRKECFSKHMNIHTGIFTCGVCSKTFASQGSLDTHMDNHEGKKTKTAKCKVCDKAFYDSSSLNKHVKNVHMNFRPFGCPDCDRKFSEKKTLTEHIRVHTGERPFSCEICSQAFKRQSELNFHMKKHTGETKLTCSECGEGFRRMSELKTHTIIKHEGDRPHKCTICGRGFLSNCLMQEHLLTHSNEKNFECEKCGKAFYSKAKLAKHNRIKSDCRKQPQKVDGLYYCRYCLLQFVELPNLNSHMKNVHEVKGVVNKYSCQVCYKEFGRRQALKRHLKIHAQVRDYKCSVCSAAFIQKHHLTQHERTHTGEKPFQCEICHKSFAQSATLYSHMKHH